MQLWPLRPVACSLALSGAGPAANAQNTFDGANPVGFQADIGNSWLALGAGFNTVIEDGLRLYGSLAYDYGFDDTRQATTGRAGLEARW